MSDTPLKKTVVAEIAIVRILTVIFQLIFLKVYTHYTSLYELGIYYFLFTISYSFNAFLLVPLDYYHQSQLYKLKSENLSLRSFYSINGWVFKFALLLLILSNVICFFVNLHLCFTAIVIICLSLGNYFTSLLRGIINNLEKRRQSILSLLLETSLKIGFFFMYVHFFAASGLLLLCTLLSASIVSLLVLFAIFVTLPEYKLANRRSFDIKEVIIFSYPMSVGALINWIQLQSYSLILVPLGFVEAVGIFGTVANVGSSGMNACSTIFSQLYVPNIYKTNGRYIKKYLLHALAIIAVVLLGSSILSNVIVGLLTKPDFVNYSLIILYGILTESGNFIIGALIIYLTIHSLTKSTLKMSAIGLIAFFIGFITLYLFNFIKVYTLGIPMVLSQCTIALGLFYLVQKHSKYE